MTESDSKWTTKVTIGFVPVPEEKEAAFWAAMDYFASVMFRDFLTNSNGGDEQKEKENDNDNT